MVLDRVNSSTRVGGDSASTAGVGFHGKRIQAGLSTQILIEVADDPDGDRFTIGAVQSLNVSEDRTVTEVYEVGTDAIIQLVPTQATTYTLSVSRLLFDFQRLPQALQREYRHIHAQRRPFDIVVTDYNPYLAGGQEPSDSGDRTTTQPAVVTTFGNCWFTSMSFVYNQNDYLITEDCDLKCEYVKDASSPTTVAGDRDALERETATSPSASIMSAFDAELPE